jgi:hypothetical protein
MGRGWGKSLFPLCVFPAEGIAVGLECAACIDALVAPGKLTLHRIVSMLHKLRSRLSGQEPKPARKPEHIEHEHEHRCR